MIDLDAIKARLAAVHAAGASGITARLADYGIRVIVQMQSWEGNTAHEANAAVTHLLGHAPADLTALVAEVERADLTALVAEVERLRGEAERERAAVVAWLRRGDACCAANATRIESGAHHREGEE